MEPTDVIRETLTIEPSKTGLFVWQDTEIVTHPITNQRATRPYGPRRFAIDGVEVDEATFMAEKTKRDADDAQRVVERQQEVDDLVAEQTTQRLAARERAAASRERLT